MVLSRRFPKSCNYSTQSVVNEDFLPENSGSGFYMKDLLHSKKVLLVGLGVKT